MGVLKRDARRFIVAKSKLTDFVRSDDLRLMNLPFSQTTIPPGEL